MKTERNPGSHVFQLCIIQRKKHPERWFVQSFLNFQYRWIYNSNLDTKIGKKFIQKSDRE